MLLTDRPLEASGVLQQEVSGMVVLLHPASGRYFSLERVSQRIWELCDGHRTVADLVVAVHAEYDAPAAEIEADVLAIRRTGCGEVDRARLHVNGSFTYTSIAGTANDSFTCRAYDGAAYSAPVVATLTLAADTAPVRGGAVVRERHTHIYVPVCVADGQSRVAWVLLTLNSPNSYLRSLKRRGLLTPALTVGDGALGFWNALAQVYPETQV